MLIRKILLLITLTSAFSNISVAKALPDDKRAAIDQILTLNNTTQLLPLMSSVISSEIIRAMSKRSGGVDQNLIALTESEVQNAVHEEFVLKNKLNEIFYQLYDEYFTTKQLQEIAAFNASKLVCSAMLLITSTTLPIDSLSWANCEIVMDDSLRPDDKASIFLLVCCTVSSPWRTLIKASCVDDDVSSAFLAIS